MMRNYAGQQQFVPTMMLQEIPTLWGIRGEILTESDDGQPFPLRFLRWQISSTDEGVTSDVRDTWSDMECVHISENGNEAWDAVNDVIVDIEANYASLSSDYFASQQLTIPEGVVPQAGVDDPGAVEFLSHPFKRPWNILVDYEQVNSCGVELQNRQDAAHPPTE
jgi:hypothetical protein